MSNAIKRAAERVKSHTRIDERGCWIFDGVLQSNGYGRTSIGAGRTAATHSVMYQALHGPVPAGMQLDHLCRNRACCNPAHLEQVTAGENIMRGLASYVIRDRCKSELHDITLPNAIYVSGRGKRTCRECRRANHRRWLARIGRQGDIMAGKPPSKGTPADQRIKGRGQKPGPKPGKAGKGSKGK